MDQCLTHCLRDRCRYTLGVERIPIVGRCQCVRPNRDLRSRQGRNSTTIQGPSTQRRRPVLECHSSGWSRSCRCNPCRQDHNVSVVGGIKTRTEGCRRRALEYCLLDSHTPTPGSGANGSRRRSQKSRYNSNCLDLGKSSSSQSGIRTGTAFFHSRPSF